MKRGQATLQLIQISLRAILAVSARKGMYFMPMGYTKPLYILPFDHRASYISNLFGWKEPLNVEQMNAVAESKQVIYEGFKKAINENVPKEAVGILVDEQFGVGLLRDAHTHGYITAASVEKSGQDEFDFVYGDDFAKHIEAVNPTFSKVLVRYNPEADAEMNKRQIQRLKRLSDYLGQSQRHFMFELLVPAEPDQLERVDQDKNMYDLQLRPGLVMRAIQELQDAGVEPDVWKIEGLDRQEDCEKVVEMARRGGRSSVSLIVLGRGADRDRVVKWLRTAAKVPGFIGFAVGRTSFWDPVVDFEAKRSSKDEAAEQVAKNFEEWISIFESGRSVSPTSRT
jgi:myo-inositol catabolism protein IolC